MAGKTKLPKCWVEGTDDVHTLVQLLDRHGIKLDKDKGPVCFHNSGSIDKLLPSIPLAVNEATPGNPVGFVVDANSSIKDRWESIKDKLKEFEIDLPDDIPGGGFIREIPDIKVRVGVWIMPDCETDQGKLEDFIIKLVPENDELWDLAKSSTTDAKSKGAKFSDNDEIKAQLHTWLAWQEKPGRPYGTAINAKYFDCDSDAALRFVDWYKNLYK